MDTNTLDQIKKLSYAEQLQLVEDIWDNIAQEAAVQSISDELKTELRRRLAEHQANPESSVPWEEARVWLESRFI